jgi:hypothetical protein
MLHGEVRVTKLEQIKHDVLLLKAKELDGRKIPSAITVDDVKVGWLISFKHKRTGNKTFLFPYRVVWELKIHTSDGNVASVYSSSVRYLTSTFSTFDVGFNPRNIRQHTMFKTRVALYGVQYTFSQAKKLRVGQVLQTEQSLRLDIKCRVLTNGAVRIPLERPRYGDWANWQEITYLKPISSQNWQLMLQSLIGQYVRDVVEVTAVQKRMDEVKKTRKQRERAEETLRALRKGQFFNGQHAKAVSIGQNFIFSLGDELHLVDSPDYGKGLYVFSTYEDAYAWASRQIDYREARKRAAAFIPHHEGWVERLSPLLQAA